LLGRDRFDLKGADNAALKDVDSGVGMVEPKDLGGWKVEGEAP
jgi:hypothetical protein